MPASAPFPVDGRIVEDGNLITAGGVTSGIDFGLALVARLLGQVEAETVQLSLEYAPAPPFQSGTPAEASPEVLARAKERLAASRERARGDICRWREEDGDVHASHERRPAMRLRRVPSVSDRSNPLFPGWVKSVTLPAMDLLRRKQTKPARGFLDDQFLIAMPGMKDDRFARAVIYMCAHSEEGAMGLMINQTQQMRFPDLLVQLGILNEQQAIRLPSKTRDFVVRNGGPVDRSRGFVLHSDDFTVESSMPVSEEICLTATVDILRAISAGRGPRQALMALGYSSWGAGQLESEIAANGWLTCPADVNLLFDADIDRKYDRILATIGVDLAHLSHMAGHA